MPAPCGVSLGLCAMRITRLLETGCVAASPNNSFVTTELVSLQLTPVVEAGADTTLTGGCDCVIASYRGIDKLKRFEFEITWPKLAPAAYEMMLGGGILTEAGFPVGVTWPTELTCGDVQPAVALEFWVKHWSGDAQDPTYPWIHHVYPQSLWQIGQQQFQNDFANPTLTGFSRKNDCWGNGPYTDGPQQEGYGAFVDISTGGFFYASLDPPADSSCNYASIAASS
jgi:hypothetical protein